MYAGDRASGDAATLAESFADLVGTMVGEFDLHELLQVLASRCVEVLHVGASGLMLADGNATLRVMVASDERAELLELFQIQQDEGPCVDCYRSGRVIVAEVADKGFSRWPHFARAAKQAGYTSVLALPMRVQGTLCGALNLFGTASHPAHGDTTVRIAQAMADVATVAIMQGKLTHERITLIDQLGTALDSRLSIEQAKGVLATERRISLDEAFDLLRQQARTSRRLLKEVATDVVESGGQISPTPGRRAQPEGG